MKSGAGDNIENPIEESISLRVITSAMAVVGVLAACQVADTPPALAMCAIAGTALGSYLSYVRRRGNNFWIKWGIAVGILVVLRVFIDQIVYRVQASITDAREPLTNMMIALLALHSFDLPRRRDLNLSALVGLVLVSSAATLSRDLTFGLYLVVFGLFGFYMFYLDAGSRTTSGIACLMPAQVPESASRSKRKSFRPSWVFVLVGLGIMCTFVCFLFLPRFNFNLFKNVRVSLRLNMPLNQSHEVNNPLLSHLRREDGSIVVDPMAYFGFAKELDLNYRGALSQQIVLRVGSESGEYWRAMSFDKYDGHRWTMSDPDTTYTRVSTYGSGINLQEVPSLMIPRPVRSTNLTQVFYYEADQPNLIPAASVPYMVYFPIGNVEVDKYGSLRSPMFMDKGTVYTVFSRVPRYNTLAMRHLPQIRESALARLQKHYANYLQLPSNLDEREVKLAHSIVLPQDTWFQKAEKINNYLRRTYAYDLSIAPTPESMDCTSDFLFEKKRGYCEHFATAFVILCRIEGIPSRLVTGFTPGEHNALTGLWEVRMQDAHAWTEIYLPRWGWVPFDPTPDGAGPGLPGERAGTVCQYFADQLKQICEGLAKDPVVAHALSDLHKSLAPLATELALALRVLWNLWSWILLIAAFVLVSVMVACFVPYLFRQFRLWKLSKTRSKKSEHFATRELVRVLRALESVQFERKPNHTTADLFARLKKMEGLKRPLPESLADDIDEFFQRYGSARFGAPGDKPRVADKLASLSAKIEGEIAEMALASARKTKD